MKGEELERHTFRSALFKGVVNEAIQFFSSTSLLELPPTIKFNGSGVYGLYYLGDFEFYQPIFKGDQNSNLPIYIGKAVPEGWRTARVMLAGSPVLYRRLSEHARSIQQCDNLNLSDFRCRFMILNGNEGDLVVPIEAELIRKFKPLWNSVVDGFGNHDPGSGRYNQAKSEWDILHPGRQWTPRLIGESPKLEEIILKIRKILK